MHGGVPDRSCTLWTYVSVSVDGIQHIGSKEQGKGLDGTQWNWIRSRKWGICSKDRFSSSKIMPIFHPRENHPHAFQTPLNNSWPQQKVGA